MEKPEASSPKTISEAKMWAATKNGSRGGAARALAHPTGVLREWGSRGGKATLSKYGREHFVAIRQLRKRYKNTPPPPLDPAIRRARARSSGREGGEQRARQRTGEELQAIARLGGIATRTRYSNDFFKWIRSQRTYYRKGYLTQPRKDRLREEALRQAASEPNPLIANLWRGVATNWTQK